MAPRQTSSRLARAVAHLAMAVSLFVASPSPAHAQEHAPVSASPEHGRLRAGFDLAVGLASGGGQSGDAFVVAANVGWQLDRHWAFVGQGSLLYWASSEKEGNDGSSSTSGNLGYRLTPLVILDAADLLEFALGPSLDGLTLLGSTSTAEPTIGVSPMDHHLGFDSRYFGMHGRVAVHPYGEPGGRNGRRVSFAVVGEAHTTFAEGTTIWFGTLGIGADWY